MRFAYVHVCFFFFNDTATTEIYTLSLHDALPISIPHFEKMLYDNALLARAYLHGWLVSEDPRLRRTCLETLEWMAREMVAPERSEEHTSELQSRQYLVCRLLLEKKKNEHTNVPH